MKTKLLAFFTILLTATLAFAGNWPEWRGPAADGISDEKDPPTAWSATDNITWKAPLPGGNSTPIVWGEQVFVTAAGEGGHVRSLYCFNRADGKVMWKDDVAFDGAEPSHADNPYCSSSPITDGKAVYAWLGSAGVIACDLAGKQVWKADIGAFTHIWGNAGTPVFYKDTLILNCGPGINCFLIALSKDTGKTVWKTEVPEALSKGPGEFKGSWSTPVLADIGGTPQILVDLPGYVAAFNPDTGAEIWRCTGLGPLAYANPLVGKDIIVAMSGYGGPSLALRKPAATDHGDLTASHRLWLIVEKKKNPQRIGSGVLLGDRIYTMEEPGFAKCIEAATGKELWHERAAGSTWASTEFVDGKLFSTDQSGETVVWKPGDKFELVSRNPLNEKTRASLAFSDGQVFARTYEALYCIGKRKAAGK